MPDYTISPTPYPDVNAVLNRLLSGVRTVLTDDFVGMYLHGSLAIGDFNPERSDIDMLVVTGSKLPGETVSALKNMHISLTGSGLKWATRMEVSYIPQQALRRFDPANASHPALRSDGNFDIDHHGPDWIIQRHVLREEGVTVWGPDPKTLIDLVSPADLRQGALKTLSQWWAPQLKDTSRLQSSEYQAYAVLTMCRILYTLEHGAVASKTAAAHWALTALDQRWAQLIERALNWRPGLTMDSPKEVLELMAAVIEGDGQIHQLEEYCGLPRNI